MACLVLYMDMVRLHKAIPVNSVRFWVATIKIGVKL